MENLKIRLFTIPNFITCFNLLSGCVGIVFAFAGALDVAMICILLSAVFDFLDGFAARLLKSYSAVGVQLDSLADMVSFGVLPALMLVCATFSECDALMLPALRYVLCCSPLLLTVFSALRLAKFNVDDRQTESFLGLPTPANALFFAALASQWHVLSLPMWVSPALVAVFCFLLISEIPMFSFKIKNFSLKKYAFQLIFLALSLVTLLCMLRLLMPVLGFSIIILLYIALSILKWVFTKRI